MAIVTALEDRAIRDAVLSVDTGPRGQPLRGKPGRGARRRDRAGVRREQRRRRGAAPCPQHVPVVRPDLAAAGCTRGPALRRGPQLLPGVHRRLLRRHPEHLHGGQTEGFAGLRNASRTAGKLLVAAIRIVPAAPSTFSGVGQRMLQADVAMNSGANTAAISDAFAAHGMTLPAPATSLPVPLPGRPARGHPRSCAAGSPSRLAPGSSSHPSIPSCMARSPTSARTGRCRSTAPGSRASRSWCRASRASPPRAAAGRSPASWVRSPRPRVRPPAQARAFARSLVANGDVRTAPRAARRLAAAPQPPAARVPHTPSHEIRLVGGQPTLVRVGFSRRR